LDAYVSLRIHLQRKESIKGLPCRIYFSSSEIKDYISSYSLYHLNLLEGLNTHHVQSKQQSISFSFQYEFFYNNPSIIISEIQKILQPNISNPISPDFINSFNRELSFNEMKVKAQASSSPLRRSNYSGDPGYYVRGTPGAWLELIDNESLQIFLAELAQSDHAKKLVDDYGFDECRPSYYCRNP